MFTFDLERLGSYGKMSRDVGHKTDLEFLKTVKKTRV